MKLVTAFCQCPCCKSFKSVFLPLCKTTTDLSLSPPEAKQSVFMKYCWPNLGNRTGRCKRSHLRSCFVSISAGTPDLYRLQLCRVMSFGQLLSLELVPTIAKYDAFVHTPTVITHTEINNIRFISCLQFPHYIILTSFEFIT